MKRPLSLLYWPLNEKALVVINRSRMFRIRPRISFPRLQNVSARWSREIFAGCHPNEQAPSVWPESHYQKSDIFVFSVDSTFFLEKLTKIVFFHSRVMNLRPSMDAEARGKTKSQLCLKYYRLIHLNSETETLFSKQGLKRIAAYEPRMGILGREPWFDSWSRSLSSSNTKILVTSQLIKLSTP